MRPNRAIGNHLNLSGYTLIELVVVVALISIMLFLTIPRLQNAVLINDTKKTIRWIIGTTQTLKENAFRQQKRFVLHLDLGAQHMWVSNETSSEEELEQAQNSAYAIPSGVKLLDVVFADRDKVVYGQAKIYFYKKGYSDKVLIHIEDDDNQPVSLLIEPFLNEVQVTETYIKW